MAGVASITKQRPLLLLVGLFLVSLALRPQLVGVGPLLSTIRQSLGVPHSVAGLLSTTIVLCMGLFAPAAFLIARRLGQRWAIGGALALIVIFGVARAEAKPPVAVILVSLTASPVRPEVARDVESAPVLAVESARPLARASPVFPESPEEERLALVAPVAPEDPDVAKGVELAAEPAEPVLPVLVADDWATARPESPEMAVGMTVTFTDPPSPPLASPTAMESADVTLSAGPPAASVAPVALPALPDFAVAVPPAAP